MMTILGIGVPVHDTGAAVVQNGEIVGAVNESRLSRVKREPRFPSSSVNYLLDQIDDPIDRVAVSGVTPFSSPYLLRDLKQEFKLLFRGNTPGIGTLKSLYDGVFEPKQTLNSVVSNLAEDTSIGKGTESLLDRTQYVEHHRAHAASAYYTSGFDSATVLTIDAAGDGFSSTVYEATDGTLTQVCANDDIDSVGKLWAQIPTVFGFKGARHAGKFMGMAAYVKDIPDELREEFRELIEVDGTNIVNQHQRQHVDSDYETIVHNLKDRLGDYGAPKVSRALQDRTEEVLTEFARAAVNQVGQSSIALAGGVVANVKLNQRIYQLPEVKQIFVHQNMGDGGLGLGAALDLWQRSTDKYSPTRLDSVYLGPNYQKKAVGQAIARADIPDNYKIIRFDEEDELVSTVAEWLANSSVVSLYQGRVEYGPRALGNRTILYQPTDPSAIEWLNNSLNRTEFMPFAPVTLYEHAEECYVGYDQKNCPAADHMTITFECTDTMRERSPGVVHVDGTARPQVLREDTNPRYHAILKQYKKQTGVPTLINTSYNMHGEPIVCTPGEALRSFLRTGNDVLVMNRTAVVTISE
jgi:carbamoyltransferase